MINKKWKGSAQNAKTRPGSDCNSDHQLLVIDLKFRLKKLMKPQTVLRFENRTISDENKVEICNRFESFHQCDDENHQISYGKRLRTLCLALQRDIFPGEEKKNYQWMSNETISEVEKRRQLKAKGLSDSGKVIEYNKQNALVQRMMREDKEKIH